MGLKELITNGLLLRRGVLSIERSEKHLESIAHNLERMADFFAPELPDTPAEELRTTSVSFSRDADQVRIQDFEEAIFRKLGRAPTEGEIVGFLDGKPVGLGQ